MRRLNTHTPPIMDLMAANTKLTLSPTKISAFLNCPRFYWYLYHKKYRRRPHGALSLGASLHRSLELVHAGPELPSLDDLLGQFQAGWSGAGFASAEEAQAGLDAGRAMLTRYLEEAPPPEEMPETLLREKMLKQDRDLYILTGRIDRLDEWRDGTLEIVDYKSGRSEVTEEQVRADVGLMVYETLVRHLYPGRTVRVGIHALRPNIRLSVLRTDDEVTAVARMLDEVAGIIAAESVWAGVNTPERCVGCDFENYCPDWRRGADHEMAIRN
jgi:putative RecB family exonuclease